MVSRLMLKVGMGKGVRIGVYFVKEPSAIVFVEDTSEAPWLFLERLYVLDLDYENITGLGVLHLERSAQVVDLRQINVLHVICAVVVANLSSGPVDTLNLDDFSVFDLSREGHCGLSQR